MTVGIKYFLLAKVLQNTSLKHSKQNPDAHTTLL